MNTDTKLSEEEIVWVKAYAQEVTDAFDGVFKTAECGPGSGPMPLTLGEFHAETVTPAKAGVQKSQDNLDSGLRRNDAKMLTSHKKA